jgi:flagellar biosynthesis protein FlhB
MSGSGDRSEKATAKRIREAREKGQIPRSRELSTAIVVTATTASLSIQAGTLPAAAARWLTQYWHALPQTLQQPGDGLRLAASAIRGGFALLAPTLLTSLVAALLAPLLVGGWNFASGALAPDWGRLNPLRGFGRIFSGNSLVELGKSVLKVGLIGGVSVLLFLHDRPLLLVLGGLPLVEALARGARLAVDGLLWLGSSLLVIAAIDVPWQLFSYAKQLRMTQQEVREEAKQSEGRPEVKGRIRRLQHAMSRGRMAESVPKADVVVTNPTHYAVALQYQPGKDRAPRVVAKGLDLLAQEIRSLARDHRVPVVEAPPLARALYRSCEIDMEIPGALYHATAQVLSYVYQLKAHVRGAPPEPPRVPDDLPGGQV